MSKHMLHQAGPATVRAHVVAVLISYNPGPLGEQLAALAPQVERVVVVDNGSRTDTLAQVREVAASYDAEVVALGQNAGIAAATNVGIERARELGATHVLLSDQDSVAAPDMVDTLLAGMATDPSIGAAGPLPAEDREGGDELVYVARAWAPKRAYPEELAQPILDVAFLIASGCLISMDALRRVGPMRSQMFIDHVDLEWGLRARAAGFRLVCVPAARLHHSLGDDVVMLPGRAQPVHVHGPIRNYYILRNTIIMVRRGIMPWRWRVRYTWWAGKYVAFNALLAGRGKERRHMLRRGLGDGFRGRLGRIGHEF